MAPLAAPGYPRTMASALSAVKVFSATLARDREVLGDKVAKWLAVHPELQLVDTLVRQSSDTEFHCLTFVLFLSGDATAYVQATSGAPRVGPKG